MTPLDNFSWEKDADISFINQTIIDELKSQWEKERMASMMVYYKSILARNVHLWTVKWWFKRDARIQILNPIGEFQEKDALVLYLEKNIPLGTREALHKELQVDIEQSMRGYWVNWFASRVTRILFHRQGLMVCRQVKSAVMDRVLWSATCSHIQFLP